MVFIPDYRSSVVYGWDHVLKAREQQDANERDFDEIMSGVDHVINMGLVDANKLALVGHSYGALLTKRIITPTERFFSWLFCRSALVRLRRGFGFSRSTGCEDLLFAHLLASQLRLEAALFPYVERIARAACTEVQA